MAHTDDERRGMSRREFLESSGLTTLALGTGALAGIPTMATAAQSAAKAAEHPGGYLRAERRRAIRSPGGSGRDAESRYRAEETWRLAAGDERQDESTHRRRSWRRRWQLPARRERQLGRHEVRSMRRKGNSRALLRNWHINSLAPSLLRCTS